MKTKSKLLSWLLIMPVMAMSLIAIPSKAQDKIYNLHVYEYNDRAAINWYTDTPYLNEIYYGESTNYGSKIASSVLADWASYELTSLTSGTTYYYKIVAKNKNGVEVANQTGEFTTLGIKPMSRVYKTFFYLNFNNNLYSFNNQYPLEELNPKGIKFSEPSIWKGALKITESNSHIIYKADPTFNGGYGTIMTWVRLEKFDKDMVFFETAESNYALYYDSLNSNSGKIVARAGVDGQAIFNISTTGTGKNIWLPGEWHQITMTWNGKMGGTVKLYIDGEKRAESSYTKGGGASTFMVGNNYKHTMNLSNGSIDDFKLFDYDLDSTSIRNEYKWLALNQKKDLISKPVVAGVSVRNFKINTLIKYANDPKVYLVGRNMEKIHIADMDALKRFGAKPIISATLEEINQYKDAGKFYSWSRLPDGLLIKNGDSNVYLVWDGQKKLIPNEATFLKYDNKWSDVVNISYDELNEYADGPNYK